MSNSDGYYNLGEYTRKISSSSPQAQLWFDRGLIWCYVFNQEEAVRCFEKAIEHDPSSTICYWGVAFASGPNYNKSWDTFDEADKVASLKKCNDANKEALQRLDNAAPWERELVEAIQCRYPSQVVDDFTPTNRAYADAMRTVYKKHKDDIDITTLFADALMNITPWELFDTQTAKPIPSSPVFEVKEVLEAGLRLPNANKHAGLNHLYIHLMEMSETPEAALGPGDNLRDLVPDGGHAIHMPTHIDVLLGDYERAVDYNIKATYADDKYFADQGGKNFYSFYRLHDYNSLIYAAMLSGKSKAALDAVDRMEATISDEMLRVESPPLADWLECYKSIRVHVLIRFGLWDDLVKLPIPEDKELYCVSVAMTYYGQAIAHASLGNIQQAEDLRKLYQEAAKRVPPTRLDHPNRIVDVLKIATAMLDGELEYRKANYEVAFEKLREAVHHDDSLHYNEPWSWTVPTRHAYAALSLEQGHVEQAAKAYAEDLGLRDDLVRVHQHPNNVWALHGYHECLVRMGRLDEAHEIKPKLQQALANADIDIKASCFCRLKTGFGSTCC